MSNGGLDSLLMNSAWKRLWKPGTPYYLPAVMLNGLDRDGIIVKSLDSIVIAQIGSIPLFSDPVLGDVSVTLTNSTVRGLASVSPGDFLYEPDPQTFQATIDFGLIVFSGNYDAEATAVSGCAVNTAKALLGKKSAKVAERRVEGSLDGDGGSIALAQDYRDKLAGMGGNGMTLVGTYYDNNDTLNEVCSDPLSPFTFGWPRTETKGMGPDGQPLKVTSDILAQETTVAAADPINPATPVGYNAYSLHSYTMQGLMLVSLQRALKKAPPEDQQRYRDAIDATLAFKNTTMPDAKQQTVSSVMTIVATAPPVTQDIHALALAEVRHPQQDEIDRRVAEIVAEFDAQQAARGEPGPPSAALASVQGSFADSISSGSITVKGTVTVSGTPPDLTLTVAITEITAALPPVVIKLGSGSGGLFDKVQNYIASSSWVQDLLSTKIANELDSDTIKSYLTDRINQSLAEVFGE